MDIKSTLIIVGIIILIVLVGIFAYSQFSYSDTQARFKSTVFELPDGYHTVASNEYYVVNMTDGHEIICMKEYKDNDTDKHIKDYVKSVEERNQTPIIQNITVGDIVIYKSSIEGNDHNYHFWFEHDGKIYTCYTNNGDVNTENFVVDLVLSAK